MMCHLPSGVLLAPLPRRPLPALAAFGLGGLILISPNLLIRAPLVPSRCRSVLLVSVMALPPGFFCALIQCGFALWSFLRPCALLNQPAFCNSPPAHLSSRLRLHRQALLNCWVFGPTVLALLRGSGAPVALLELFFCLLCSSPWTCRQVLLRLSFRCRCLFQDVSSASPQPKGLGHDRGLRLGLHTSP